MRLSELGRFRPMPRGWFTVVKHGGLFALSVTGFAIAGRGWLIGGEFATSAGRVVFGALCAIQCYLFIADCWSARGNAWVMQYIRRNVIGYDVWCWLDHQDDSHVVVEARLREPRAGCVDAVIPSRAPIVVFPLGGWRRDVVRVLLNYGAEKVEAAAQRLQGLVSVTLWDIAVANTGATGVSPEFTVSDVKKDRVTFSLADMLHFFRWYFKDSAERPVLLGAVMALLVYSVEDLSSRTVEVVDEGG